MGGLGDCLIAMGLGRTTLWGLAVESLLANALWEILVSCVPCGLSKDRLVWGGGSSSSYAFEDKGGLQMSDLRQRFME